METRYAYIARQVAERIASGSYPVGAILPTEHELAEQFGVSRATVRAALRELQQLGLLSRRRNIGTRVESTVPSEKASGYAQSFAVVNDLLQYAQETRRAVQTITSEVADTDLAARLPCRPGRRWLRVSSIRVNPSRPDDKPICWTDVYVDYTYAEIVREHVHSYSGAIGSLIEERTGRRIAAIFQTIRATGVPDDMALALKAAPASHALEITRHYRDSVGDSFLISVSIHPADRFAYLSMIQRQAVAEPSLFL